MSDITKRGNHGNLDRMPLVFHWTIENVKNDASRAMQKKQKTRWKRRKTNKGAGSGKTGKELTISVHVVFRNWSIWVQRRMNTRQVTNGLRERMFYRRQNWRKSQFLIPLEMVSTGGALLSRATFDLRGLGDGWLKGNYKCFNCLRKKKSLLLYNLQYHVLNMLTKAFQSLFKIYLCDILQRRLTGSWLHSFNITFWFSFI